MQINAFAEKRRECIMRCVKLGFSKRSKLLIDLQYYQIPMATRAYIPSLGEEEGPANPSTSICTIGDYLHYSHLMS